MADRSRLPAAALPAAVLLALIFGPDLALAVAVLPPVQARMVGPYSRFLLRSLEIALQRAAEKLSDERCRTIFGDFTDLAGRPLSLVLSGADRTGESYLSTLAFRDGTFSRPCADGAILAWTSPGSRAITLCGIRFAAAAHRDPDLASVIVIHEELHSLGLGENPPSSAEISARIAGRCR